MKDRLEAIPNKETYNSSALTAVYIPKNIITNQDLAEFLDQKGIRTGSESRITAEGIEAVTGIRERHWCVGLGDSPLNRALMVPQMATEAALGVLSNNGWLQVDSLFACTSFPYKKSLSFEVAKNIRKDLGIDVENTMPDIYAECTSPIWALHYIRVNDDVYYGKNILIVCSEYLSPISDDINLSLPSDCASALGFTNGRDLDVLGSAVKYFPKLKHMIRVSIKREYIPEEGSLFFFDIEEPRDKGPDGEEQYGFDMHYGEIEGPSVLKWALHKDTLPPIIDEALEIAKLEPADITHVIPHQANGRITEGLIRLLPRLGINAEVFSNIAKHGNTGSVSAFLGLHEASLDQKKIGKGDKILFLGFGAGATAGAAIIGIN
ncbi:hypothetical protein A2164_03685 [Candidatus Curtissbacteria bacterium RBG_13_35_7]|uniref:Beta-ketoacyl-[acyl-carrier-protein] synthase III C-terminal domain-containing protein n=1 Tax=Candidatus Curtissbacteria bacterium RBG_13_35_7 TaxID=1797705 RepID=A0A1F5G3M3_9BACT|nr:MAG: hypothetical protein A2164_03685 [Candidatus Curtissbacteria bacterium RBG_13_35_7]